MTRVDEARPTTSVDEPLGWRPPTPFLLMVVAQMALWLGLVATGGASGFRGVSIRRLCILIGVFLAICVLVSITALLVRRRMDIGGRYYLANTHRRWWSTRGVWIGLGALAVEVVAIVAPLFSPLAASVMETLMRGGAMWLFPLLILAMSLLDAGVRGYQRGTTPHCGSCDYPCPSTTEGSRCPECGRAVWKWTVKTGERVRSARAAILGLVIFVGVFVPIALPLTGAGAIVLRAASTASLVQMLGGESRMVRRGDVWAEIERRKGMSSADRETVAARALDILTDPEERWKLGAGAAGWLVEQIIGGTLSDATMTRAVRFILPLSSADAGMAYGLADDLLPAELQPREARAVFERMMEAMRSDSLALWQAGARSWLAARLASPDLSEQDEATLIAAAAATGLSTRSSIDVMLETALALSPSAPTAGRAVRMWTAAHRERLARDSGGVGAMLREALCAAVLAGTAPTELEDAFFADEGALGRVMHRLGPGQGVADRIAARLSDVLREWLARGWRVWAAYPQAWAWLCAQRQAGTLDQSVGAAMDRAIEADMERQRASGANPGKG